MSFARVFAVVLVIVTQTACLVGPNYKRPQVNVPTTYRGPDGVPTSEAPSQSLGDQKWSAVFQDPELQSLIRTALEKNFDVRIAASRIVQAQQQVIVQRSQQFPNLSGVFQDNGLRFPPTGSGFPSFAYNTFQLGLSASWNIDFWGQYRRATEAARANLLATEWARRAVTSSLVANVAAAYLQLRQLDLQLEISRRTLESRQESLKLTEELVNGGASPLTDQRQAEQLVETTAATIPDLERLIQQQENAIDILLGQNPGPIKRGRPLLDQTMPPSIPAGLPSALLEHRPDIQQAEANLIAANAQIGVARAAFFPSISLTGLGGVQSVHLSNLLNGSQRAWNYTGTASQPIFTAGRLRANLKIAEAQRDQYLLTYQQRIQQAFREVSDALIAYQKYRDFREHEEKLVEAARSASELSHQRYQGGATSYLEVLTNETNYYSAELNLATARFNERLAVVQLYNALGGGWQ